MRKFLPCNRKKNARVYDDHCALQRNNIPILSLQNPEKNIDERLFNLFVEFTVVEFAEEEGWRVCSRGVVEVVGMEEPSFGGKMQCVSA